MAARQERRREGRAEIAGRARDEDVHGRRVYQAPALPGRIRAC
jgi:hypothetical protein